MSYLVEDYGGKTVKELGEQGLLPIIQRFSPQEIIGDDAAWLKVESDKLLVVTTDLLVEGVHFSDRTTPPESVGWRGAAANLSDLAAMGASPLGVTVGLSLRGDLNVDWIEKLYQGMSGCLQPYCCNILGGDISRSPVLTISITAFGQVSPQHLIRRSSAQPGDVIVVTGHHGLSRGGLELLLNPSLVKSLEQSNRTEIVPKLILAHQKPQPRLDILPYLQQFPELSGIAGMDSSDGLADAVIQICRASGVGAEIEFNSLPIPQDLLLLTSPEQALEWVLYGGEDFELVLALPLSQAQSLVRQIGNGAAIIGKIVLNKRVVLKDGSGIRREQVLSLDKGFQHFN